MYLKKMLLFSSEENKVLVEKYTREQAKITHHSQSYIIKQILLRSALNDEDLSHQLGKPFEVKI